MKILFFAAALMSSFSPYSWAQADINKVGPLQGTWENDHFTVTYFAEGFAVPASKSNATALGVLSASTSGNVLHLKNLTTPNGATPESAVCSTQNEGSYNYVIQDNTLTMKVSNDPCEDRAASVSSFIMHRALLE